MPVFFKSFTLMITHPGTCDHLSVWSSMPGGGHGLGCDWEPGPKVDMGVDVTGSQGLRVFVLFRKMLEEEPETEK